MNHEFYFPSKRILGKFERKNSTFLSKKQHGLRKTKIHFIERPALHDILSGMSPVMREESGLWKYDLAMDMKWIGVILYMEIELETRCLRIIALSRPCLKLLIEGTPVLEKKLGLNPSGLELEEHTREAMTYLDDLAGNIPDSYPWITNWQIILKERNLSIGSACFMNVPDDAGEVEIGYGIYPDFQNRGYMTEALDRICRWALTQSGVRAVAGETEPGNLPSRRVLEKCGFFACGETRFLRRAVPASPAFPSEAGTRETDACGIREE